MCTHCYRLAGDKSRHRILSLLKKRSMNVNGLAKQLHVTQPTITHHLRRLADAGLLRMEKRGREHLYSLAKDNECFSECGLLQGL